MIAASGSTRSQLAEELSRVVAGEVRFDRFARQMYSTDASIYKMTPIGVVLPRDADDVSAVIETCSSAGVSVLPRGGGTGLSGQTVNRGVVIDFSKYMHDVIEINREEGWVHTQPGITIDELNRQVGHTGKYFTPDPSTSSRANIGGAMGNNSCGSHSIIYGKTVDQVQQMSVVLSDGSRATFEALNAAQLEGKMALSNLEGQIYRGIPDVADRAANEVDRRFPKILRRVGGYNIDRVYSPGDGPIIDLTQVMVGSEGTLAAVTDRAFEALGRPEIQRLGSPSLPHASRLNGGHGCNP